MNFKRKANANWYTCQILTRGTGGEQYSNIKIRVFNWVLIWILHCSSDEQIVEMVADIKFAIMDLLRRIPFKVRAITCKNYLLKIYSQHANFLNAT